ncbi:MAG: AAA family ATPase [Nitrospirae bacterium]|nr:AAA family ATPase [Nitrospirota bacterium]
MYETYYQLKTSPFTLLPDPEFLFLGSKHKMALSLLEYGLLNGSAFIVITGEPGTGKTTLLNRLLNQSGHQWTIGMLSNTHAGLAGLMPWIAASFSLETTGKSEVELFHEFARFLESQHASGQRVLLVLDEAQNVGSAMLEELRLLSNLNDGLRRSLQILLSGQPGLRSLLGGPGMEQFAQRISVEYALDPLTEEETVAYISHRIRVAGGLRPLFSTLACRTIYALTAGVPRLINQLCDHALVYGYAAQDETITARVILDAARIREKNGFFSFRTNPHTIEPSHSDLEGETDEIAANIPLKPEPDTARPAAVSPSAGTPVALYQEALSLKQAGEFSKAIPLFDRVIDDRVWGVKALGQKGLCMKAIGRYEEALATFRIAFDRPSVPPQELEPIRYLFARTLESMGRSDEAIECYRSIKRDGRNYRDVTLRIDQLQLTQTLGPEGSKSWLQSFAKSCSQLLRSTN